MRLTSELPSFIELTARVGQTIVSSDIHRHSSPLIQPPSRLSISRFSPIARGQTRGPAELVGDRSQRRTSRKSCCNVGSAISHNRLGQTPSRIVFRWRWHTDSIAKQRPATSTTQAGRQMDSSLRRRDPPRPGRLLPNDRIQVEGFVTCMICSPPYPLSANPPY